MVIPLISPKAKQMLRWAKKKKKKKSCWQHIYGSGKYGGNIVEGQSPAPLTTMKIVNQNVRGLGNGSTFCEAKIILQLYRPQIMFLCEANLTAKQMQNKCRELDYENCLKVRRNRLGGGLAILWNREVMMEVKSYSKHHIDTMIHTKNGCY